MNETIRMINETRLADGKSEISQDLANEIRIAEVIEANAQRLVESIIPSDSRERIEWAFNEHAEAKRRKCELIAAAFSA